MIVLNGGQYELIQDALLFTMPSMKNSHFPENFICLPGGKVLIVISNHESPDITIKNLQDFLLKFASFVFERVRKKSIINP